MNEKQALDIDWNVKRNKQIIKEKIENIVLQRYWGEPIDSVLYEKIRNDIVEQCCLTHDPDFKVICDEINNPPEVVDNNAVAVTVMFSGGKITVTVGGRRRLIKKEFENE